MFSGIVEEAALVESFERKLGASRLVVKSSLDQSKTQIGESIAVEGTCLTVVERNGNVLEFELLEETLRKTSLGDLSKGSRVNLERSLELGSRLHGHFVFGHVDATVSLLMREAEGESVKMTWSLPKEIRPYVAQKGSISLAGVSLTVGEVEKDSFCVYLIPHTLEVTTLSDRKVGDRINVEIDMLARYVVAAIGLKDDV